ncbi:thioredoxin-like 3-2, chloroplastic isoform X2 [Asparagus officinalis]|uniref:thioredoxin-like 3-2, chloroplastic isoform X2 n=1 Tax=Asparagus officinalis TaxID=4686 RepID=UPI00098E6B2A|nr:thioredoxin-like 3-2, chloroplastic isoform X2 [Asparagus officinalis]
MSVSPSDSLLSSSDLPSLLFPRSPHHRHRCLRFQSNPIPVPSPTSSISIEISPFRRRRRQKATSLTTASIINDENDSPTSIDLEPITSEAQFDRTIAEAQQLGESIAVLWKCLYLKPKLEKLAADYYPRIRFYCVDVNAVPQKLVTRAGITKMPTIQLWRDSQKQNEVIGGHKAWLVVNDVRRMIDNED